MTLFYQNKRGIFMWIAICSFSMISAQKMALKGVIVNSKTNKPLEHVSILIEGTNFQTFTGKDGVFSFLQPLPEGNQVLICSKDNFKTIKFPVIVEVEKTKKLGFIGLEPSLQSEQNMGVISLADNELSQVNGSFDNISGLLRATKDVFLNAAAFDFSPTFFRPRGLNSNHGKVLINGIEMNKLYNGRPQWSNWGGLNDVQRNRVFSMGMAPSSVSFGGLAGTTNIVMRAAKYTEGGKFSIARANRSYSGRLMGSYHTGLLPSGWAFSVSISRRYGKESFRDGTIYDANSFFASVGKKINESHSLNFSGIFTPYRRGKTSANTQEVFNLKGIKYNSYWGYQNGKIRNSRIREIVEPIFMLNHYWELSDNTSLNTNLAYQFGKIGNSRLGYGGSRFIIDANGQQGFIGGGTNPDPSYYQKLPSYFLRFEDDLNYRAAYIAEKEFIADGQIDWASLYLANKTAAGKGGNAVYILYEDRNDDNLIIANSILRHEFNEHITFHAKLGFQNLRSENFAQIIDLLGGEAYLDVDSFSEGEKAQNNLLTPNRLVGEGEAFKYHFQLEANVFKGFTQTQFKYKKFNFHVGAKLAQTTYQRTGYFKNGNFPDNSLGKSKMLHFTDYGFKTGITYKLTGEHIFRLNASYFTKAPNLRNSFSNSRQNNAVVIGLESEKIQSVDINYVYRSPVIKSRLTGYFTQIKDATEISFYYADGISGLGRNSTTAFVQEVLHGINKRYLGGELGISAQVTPTIKLKAAAGIGEFVYSNNPNLYLTSDDFDEPVHYGTSLLKNYKLAGGPQQAYQLGFSYRAPEYWFFTISGNYFSHAFLDVAPLTRTRNFATDADGLPLINYDPEVAKKLLKQEQFDDYFLVNIIGGKSWRINDYFIGFFASINNVLNTVHKTGGYEQSRKANYQKLKQDKERDHPIFGPKYWYGYGTTFYAHIYVRF